MIIRNYKLVKEIKVLGKFASKDETRSYLMQVVYNTERKEFVATDGKVLAVYNTKSIDYDVEIALKKVSDGCHNVYILDKYNIFIDDNECHENYPKYERIFTKSIGNGIDFYSSKDKKIRNKEVPRFLIKLGVPIDLSFFDIVPKDIVFKVYKTEKEMINFESDNYTILVMPVEEER